MADEVPTVNMSNTKKELLEAYEAAKKVLVKREKELLNAEKAKESAEERAAVMAAESECEKAPLQRIHELRSAIGKELVSLADRFESEMETFQQVRKAVELKQKELQDLFDIEAAASDLAALIEAQNQRKTDFEESIEQQQAELTAEIEQTRQRLQLEIAEQEAEWAKRKETTEKQLAEEEQIRLRTREREQEEYDYALKREREQRRNKLEDELAELDRAVAAKREELARETEQREAEWTEREAAVAKHEEKITELEARVEAFPAELDKAVKKAIAETTQRLTTEAQHAAALAKAQFNADKRVLESQIESLTRTVDAQQQQLELLQQRHENAYEKVQDIANRAVAAAKREIISIPPTPQDRQEK